MFRVVLDNFNSNVKDITKTLPKTFTTSPVWPTKEYVLSPV